MNKEELVETRILESGGEAFDLLLFSSTTNNDLRALSFFEATLLGVWRFYLNPFQAYKEKNTSGD